MGSGSLAELIAELKAAIRGVLKGVQAFAPALRPKAPEKLPAAPAAHFGEHERLEEAKYYPPAPSYTLKLEEGALPDSYGKTRLVMLVVDPNLVHAYWEVAPDKLQEVRAEPEDSVRAVLRFYEASTGLRCGRRSRVWKLVCSALERGQILLCGSWLERRGRKLLPVGEVQCCPYPPGFAGCRSGGTLHARGGARAERAELVPPPPYRKPRRPERARLSRRAPVSQRPPGLAAAGRSRNAHPGFRGNPEK